MRLPSLAQREAWAVRHLFLSVGLIILIVMAPAVLILYALEQDWARVATIAIPLGVGTYVCVLIFERRRRKGRSAHP